jgi:glycine C-acetyltransferase
MYGKIKEHLQNRLQTIEDNGIFKKKESSLRLKELKLLFLLETVLNFCSNNYLGLSSHPEGSSS